MSSDVATLARRPMLHIVYIASFCFVLLPVFFTQVTNNGNVRLSNMELLHDEGGLISCDHPSFLYPTDEPYECRGTVSLGWDQIEAGFWYMSAT